ncbi:MAG: hypothetical protein ACYC99_18100, partial [Candidatus Geothermincolia bacterium]
TELASLTIYMILEAAFLTMMFTVLAFAGKGEVGDPMPYLLIAWVVLIIGEASAYGIYRRFARIRSRSVILADSIAADMTSNPGSLREVMKELDGQGLSGEIQPITRYGFGSKTGEKLDGEPLTKRFYLKDLNKDLKHERDDNLRAIERGARPGAIESAAPMEEPVEAGEWE